MLMFRHSHQPERTESRLLDYWEAGMQRGKRRPPLVPSPIFRIAPFQLGCLRTKAQSPFSFFRELRSVVSVE
jgi:hypothetical protein